MKKSLSVREMVVSAMIAACYIALGTVFAPLSFGQVQVRFAEVLTLLPILSPTAIWGVTVGCAVTNIFGLSMGANIIGVYDILFGTAATLLAALLTRALRGVRIKGVPYFAAIPPVLINAIVVGAELTFVMSQGFNLKIFAINFALIAIGQFVSCFVLGLPLVRYLERTGIGARIFK